MLVRYGLCQLNTSYSIKIYNESEILHYTFIAGTDSNDASFVVPYQLSTGIGILDENGTIISSFTLAKKNHSIHTIPTGYQRFNNWHLISVFQQDSTGSDISFYDGIIAGNFNTGVSWGIKTGKQGLNGRTPIFTNDGRLFITHFWLPNTSSSTNKIGFSQIIPNTGECLFSYLYSKEGSQYNDFYTPAQTIETINSNLIILGNENFSEHHESYLLKLSPEGSIIDNVSFPMDSIWLKSICNDQQNKTYACGLKNKTTFDTYSFKTAVITKIDKNFELIWTKQIPFNNYPIRDIQIATSFDNNLYIAIMPWNQLNIILLKMNPAGEIIWQKAYPYFVKDVSIQQKSFFLISSAIDSLNGEALTLPLILKSNMNGDISDCKMLSSCLNIEPTVLSLTKNNWQKSTGQLLPNFEVKISSNNFIATPYCPDINLTAPYFTFPDTLCQFTCKYPDSLVNSLVDWSEWLISGPNLDTIIIDSSFYWCFDTPGTYQIEQSTSFLECVNYYNQQLEVIPDNINLSLGENRIICEELPFRLLPTSNRTNLTYIWQNETNHDYLDLWESGNYALTVSDGYCVDSTSVSLKLPRASMLDPLFDLELDKTVCFESLPFIFTPKSNYSANFILDNKINFTNNIDITTSGDHNIGFYYKGCFFEEKFTINTIPCPANIYLPNVFSPNQDGINDFIEPLGEKFKPLKIQIFNRWGDLVFQTHAGLFKWDGTFLGKEAPIGVYVLRMDYLNLKTQKKENIQQEILLIR